VLDRAADRLGKKVADDYDADIDDDQFHGQMLPLAAMILARDRAGREGTPCRHQK
jgi:hypothetical protein